MTITNCKFEFEAFLLSNVITVIIKIITKHYFMRSRNLMFYRTVTETLNDCDMALNYETSLNTKMESPQKEQLPATEARMRIR